MKTKLNSPFYFSGYSLGLVLVAVLAFTIAPVAHAKKPVKAPVSKSENSQVLKAQVGTKGDEYYFVVESPKGDKLVAKAGQEIELTFTNRTSKDAGLSHNLVVVKPGTVDTVSNEGIQAGQDKGWINATSSDIIAHTKLINSGESETIKFKAPSQAGEYPFVCTFPGHSTTMRGVLLVKT